MVAKDYEESAKILNCAGTIRREVHVFWHPPKVSWLKCNVDDTSKDGGHAAGCEGVVRDSTSQWIFGFKMYLDRLDSLSAEMWGIWKGLELAWNSGCHRVVLESDSKEPLSRIRGREQENHPLEALIQKIRNILRRDWEVKLEHSLREGNTVANRLASSAVDMEPELFLLEEPPEVVRPLLLKDLRSFGVYQSDVAFV